MSHVEHSRGAIESGCYSRCIRSQEWNLSGTLSKLQRAAYIFQRLEQRQQRKERRSFFLCQSSMKEQEDDWSSNNASANFEMSQHAVYSAGHSDQQSAAQTQEKSCRRHHSLRWKLYRLLSCVKAQTDMGSTYTKPAQSTNRSNAAASPTFTRSTFLHARRSLRTKQETLPQNLEGIVHIVKLGAKIDEKPTTVDERSPAVLKYRTPHFRASATVRIPPIPDKESWQIGWIQACTDMFFMNTYGPYGVSSWEFPELKTGGYPMISDSDGRNYPWYGSRTEVVTIVGPTSNEQSVHVSMNDNFYPHITWSVPLKNHRESALTHVRRTQGFYTWLAAKNIKTGAIYILKTVRWSMHLEIAVEPSRTLGHRARLIGSGIQQQPKILDYNVEIPRCALEPPNANSAQTLLWYPTVGQPQVIVPSKWNPDDYSREE